jgi:hypothetical protein
MQISHRNYRGCSLSVYFLQLYMGSSENRNHLQSGSDYTVACSGWQQLENIIEVHQHHTNRMQRKSDTMKYILMQVVEMKTQRGLFLLVKRIQWLRSRRGQRI